MSAEQLQAVGPNDPAVILRELPEGERSEFLRQYQDAVDAARDPSGYRQLQKLLRGWGLVIIAAGRPGYYEHLAAVREGTARTTSAEEAIPDWADRLAAAQARRR